MFKSLINKLLFNYNIGIGKIDMIDCFVVEKINRL